MCQDKNACQSFVLFYDNFECWSFDHDVTETVKDDSTVDVDAAWFVKVCLKTGKVEVILFIVCQYLLIIHVKKIRIIKCIFSALFELQSILLKQSILEQCNRLWSFEVVRGATLINNDTKILPNKMSRTECERLCINETSFVCKSIKFKVTNDTVGQCILSNSDRHLMPFAYRVSTNNDYYLEYQCINNTGQGNYSKLLDQLNLS